MERRGLGKGLGALIPGAEIPEKHTSLEIDIDRIRFSPYQPRESLDEEKLRELADSIRVHGVLQPVLVRSREGGDYELVAGERRLRAASAAGLTRIPAIVRELTDEQSFQVALIENIQREDINAVDAAVAYRRLLDEFGLSQEELAAALGKSRSAIANTLRLLNLPADVLRDMREGRITEGHARAALSLSNERDQVALCDRIKKLGLSVREAERLAKHWRPEFVQPRSGESVSRETFEILRDPHYRDIESRLREVFRTKVRIVTTKDRGRLEIEFYTDDDLHRILTLLLG